MSRPTQLSLELFMEQIKGFFFATSGADFCCIHTTIYDFDPNFDPIVGRVIGCPNTGLIV